MPQASPTRSTAPPATAAPRRRRIWELDALRGFALAGALLVNVESLTGGDHDPDATHIDPVARFLDLVALESFFSLLSFLFGVSFALVSAQRDKPLMVLARRCVFLIPVGLLHQVLMPGEALLWFGLWGTLLLLPTLRVQTWQLGLAGAAVLGLGFAHGAEFLLIPGLFLAGAVFTRLGWHEQVVHASWLTAVFWASVPVSAMLIWWDALSDSDAVMSLSGLGRALTYSTGLLLLLRTRIGPALRAFFAPIGLLALTNYVSASVLAVGASQVMEFHGFGPLLALAAAILLVQWVWSRWILTRWRFGPLEWAWRAVTWWNWHPTRT